MTPDHELGYRKAPSTIGLSEAEINELKETVKMKTRYIYCYKFTRIGYMFRPNFFIIK